MPQLAGRLTAVISVALILAGAAAHPASAAAGTSATAAESELVSLLNAERAKVGLAKVRVDPRLTEIARARSNDMAERHYFSHDQPDGRDVSDLLDAARIVRYASGEIIAWNTRSDASDSARNARDLWMGSAPHRAIVLSRELNYFGVALAVDPSNGRRLWTGVYIQGPDRTGGWTALGAPPDLSIPAGERHRTVTVRWTGGDVQLVTLTSGFRHFQVRVRADGGAWQTWSSATTGTSRSIRVWRGHTYDMAIRACDHAGNCGAWAIQHLAA